ncbi:lipase 3-like [Condylostylus longicornis]|uniref:lipase 3-like n=1 Tax=Condylostylus longicornis TaxID=2530218 RepID=UPI00244E3F0B|nr:lipase 3-like [Condylostylus longicornis]
MLFKILLRFYCFVAITVQGIRIGPIIKDALRRDVDGEDYKNNVSYRDGYKIEDHDITTKDGYIIRLNRISSNVTENEGKNKLPPVYLFHGLLENSEIWLVSGPGRALAYLLCDAGYDVWLGNARGTTHSRRHRYLKPNQHEFWDFTWHEIGIYDNPANIDYILKKTGKRQIHYIGHSQGTTTFFVLTSLLPEYNDKIKTMHALAPVTFMKYTTSVYFTLPALYIPTIYRFTTAFGLEEYFPNSLLFASLQNFCRSEDPDSNLCYKLLSIGGGANPKQIDAETLFKFFKYAPAGASIYQALHYSQLHLNGEFQSFDYGEKGNLKRYKQKTPIKYSLEKVTATPINLYVSGNDPISSLKDVKTLISKLPIKPNYIEIADKEWNHFDYLIGKQAKELCYDKILKSIISSDS